jgi:hypothetical protein
MKSSKSRKPTSSLNKKIINRGPLVRMLWPIEVALLLPSSREPMPKLALLRLIPQVPQGGSF